MDIERGLVKISTGYVHYRASGQGKPIILMHSAGGSSAIFRELMAVLARKLRTFAIDHPSYGMSDHIPGNPTIVDYAKYVTEVMDGLGVKRASFLGESTSGCVAVELANTHPDRVEKIIMVSCPFYPSEEYKRKRHVAIKGEQHPTDPTGFPLPRTLEFMREKDSEHIPMHPTQDWVDRRNLALIEAGRDRSQLLGALAKYDLPSNLEGVQCPVLVIWGEHFFALQFRDQFTSHIKNHQVFVVKDGRFNPHWEHPEEVGVALLKFLA